MTVGIFLCGTLILRKAKRVGIGIEEMIIVMASAIGVGLFCAGLFYLLVTYPIGELFHKIIIGEFDFMNNTGLVFYGGLIGGIVGAILALHWQRLDIKQVEPCVVPFLPLGHAIGRIGCLLAGCCHGFEYSGPLAVASAFADGKTFFPIQGVEALLNFVIMTILLLYAKRTRPPYHILSLYLLLYSSLRFVLEFLRGDWIRGSLLFLSTSQWISIGLFLIGTSVLLAKRK